jgi:two-component system chemotaxis response regulator CheY
MASPSPSRHAAHQPISRFVSREFYMATDTNMRVLVVDDFSTMRRIIKNILRQLGFNNIVEADDGSTAWDVLNKDKIDFVISDWNMPIMTGIEFLKKVRASEEFSDLPFLMVTAEAQQENIIEAVQAKVSNYIVKPFTAETLGQKIDKIFA